MRKCSTLPAIGVVMVLSVSAVVPAHAQLFPGVTVNDPLAIAQMIDQVTNSATQIARLESQLTNQLKMLETLKTDFTQPLASINQKAAELLQGARAIGYSSQDIVKQFDDLYPDKLSNQTFAQLKDRLRTWDSNSRLTLQDSMRVQNQLIQSQATTAGAVRDAVAASQGAEGQTAATQATNQLLVAVSSQLQGLQTILVTQARTQETILAQQQAALTAARAESARHNTYTPVQGSFTDRTSF